MIEYSKAYQMAKTMFAKNGYLDQIDYVCELPDKWLFHSRFQRDSIVEYGNCPISVNKETGNAEWFNIFAAGTGNYAEYENAKLIDRDTGKEVFS